MNHIEQHKLSVTEKDKQKKSMAYFIRFSEKEGKFPKTDSSMYLKNYKILTAPYGSCEHSSKGMLVGWDLELRESQTLSLFQLFKASNNEDQPDDLGKVTLDKSQQFFNAVE